MELNSNELDECKKFKYKECFALFQLHRIINNLMNPRSNIQIINRPAQASRMHPIRKKNINQIIFWICPDQGARIARMTKSGEARVFWRTTFLWMILDEGFVETDAASDAFVAILAAGEFIEGGFLDDLLAAVATACLLYTSDAADE